MRTLVLLAAAATLFAGGATASVTVFGSDSATQCSNAAVAGASDSTSESLLHPRP